MRFFRMALSCFAMALVFAAIVGCGNEKLNALAEKAKAAAAKGAESVKKQVAEKVGDVGTELQETAQLAGRINLTLDSPIETKACYARFVSQGSKRPTVFELRSYRSPDQEEAPSVLFHAQVQAGSVAELSGQVVAGRLFVQPTSEGPTWYSTTSSPVELKITSVTDQEFTAEIVSASLQNTQTGGSISATGTFNAVPQ